MGESWLEIPDEQLDAQEIERRIQERMAQRTGGEAGERALDRDQDGVLPGSTPPVGESARNMVSRWLRDCDIVPANYVIDWRVPILGPIHTAIRRVIHAEMRRFLLPALEKQSHLNRAVLQALAELLQENARLSSDLEQVRQELAQLRQGQEPDD